MSAAEALIFRAFALGAGLGSMAVLSSGQRSPIGDELIGDYSLSDWPLCAVGFVAMMAI
jgi:hypothetical protein